MQKALRPLFLLHPDVSFRAQLCQAVGSEFEIETSQSWAALAKCIQRATRAATAVVDPYAGKGGVAGLAPELRKLLSEFSSISIFAAFEIRPGCHSDLRALGEWGVVEVISLGEDDLVKIKRLLHRTPKRPLWNLLERCSALNKTPAHARVLLVNAAEIAAAGGQRADLARALHISERTLLRRCEGLSLPGPRKLLAWMRLLLAAELVEDTRRSVEHIALACGYSSGTGLRRQSRELVGVSFTTLRNGRGFDDVARRFEGELTQVRKRRE